MADDLASQCTILGGDGHVAAGQSEVVLWSMGVNPKATSQLPLHRATGSPDSAALITAAIQPRHAGPMHAGTPAASPLTYGAVSPKSRVGAGEGTRTLGMQLGKLECAL